MSISISFPLGVRHTQDMPPGVSEGLNYIELRVMAVDATLSPPPSRRQPRLLQKSDLSTLHAGDPAEHASQPLVPSGCPLFCGLHSKGACRDEGPSGPSFLKRASCGRQGGRLMGTSWSESTGSERLLQSERANDRSYRDLARDELKNSAFQPEHAAAQPFSGLYYTWTERLEMAKRDLAALIPSGDTFVLVTISVGD